MTASSKVMPGPEKRGSHPEKGSQNSTRALLRMDVSIRIMDFGSSCVNYLAATCTQSPMGAVTHTDAFRSGHPSIWNL